MRLGAAIGKASFAADGGFARAFGSRTILETVVVAGGCSIIKMNRIVVFRDVLMPIGKIDVGILGTGPKLQGK